MSEPAGSVVMGGKGALGVAFFTTLRLMDRLIPLASAGGNGGAKSSLASKISARPGRMAAFERRRGFKIV